MRLARLAAVLLALAMGARPCRGTITVGAWQPVYRGIAYATGSADASEPRRQQVRTMRIDLLDPSIEFLTTPSNGAASLDTVTAKTSTFLKDNALQIAINGGFYGPTGNNVNTDVSGLQISRGTLVSEAASDFGNCILRIGADNVAMLVDARPLPYDTSGIHTAVPGSHFILVNGVPNSDTTAADPRSLAGLSADGAIVLNRPSNLLNSERYVGSHLGVSAQNLPPPVTVTFDAQGGTVSPAGTTVTNGMAYGTLPMPTRTDYTFAGWWTEADGGGAQVTSATIVATASGHTLYARWDAIAPLDAAAWARVTVAFDYTSDRAGGLTYYSVALNGVPLVVPGDMGHAYRAGFFARSPDGVWLVSANPTAKQVRRVTLDGAGGVDDLVVTTDERTFLPYPPSGTQVPQGTLMSIR